MATYLRRVATTPEVAHGGSSVVPDERPPLEDEPGGEGFAGVLEEPGSVDRPELREPGLGEPEEVEEAGLEETAEALRGTEGDEGAQGAAATDAGSSLREGVSPVEPVAPGLEREGPVEPTSTIADRPLAELRVDDLVGMPLLNNWGREIGTIEDLVVAERDPQSVYAVVSESGALGIAGDEGIVPLERLRVPTPMAVQLRLDGGAEGGGGDGVEGLADLPAYDPTGYRSLPRTQQLGEVTGAQGLTVE
jgi:sporulation protein YlmC with PRC-barrel domain